MTDEGELKVIKVYGNRVAEVKHRFIFPRKSFKEIEESLIKQVNDYRDNHVVFLVESSVIGYANERIALYFHDYAVMIGKEEDIIITKKWR